MIECSAAEKQIRISGKSAGSLDDVIPSQRFVSNSSFKYFFFFLFVYLFYVFICFSLCLIHSLFLCFLFFVFFFSHSLLIMSFIHSLSRSFILLLFTLSLFLSFSSINFLSLLFPFNLCYQFILLIHPFYSFHSNSSVWQNWLSCFLLNYLHFLFCLSIYLLIYSCISVAFPFFCPSLGEFRPKFSDLMKFHLNSAP